MTVLYLGDWGVGAGGMAAPPGGGSMGLRAVLSVCCRGNATVGGHGMPSGGVRRREGEEICAPLAVTRASRGRRGSREQAVHVDDILWRVHAYLAEPVEDPVGALKRL